MEEKNDRFATLMAGRDRRVTTCHGPEDVRVRQLPIKLYPKLLECIDDENALAELYCDKPKGWADTLAIESLEDVIAEADALNADFFGRWMARRVQRMERVRPGIVDRMLDRAAPSPAPSHSPTSPPRSPRLVA